MRRLLPMALALCGLLGFSALASAATPAVATSNVNLRAGPSTSFPVITTLPQGAGLTTYGCLADYSWCDVSWGGNRGWLAAAYIQMIYRGGPVIVSPAVAPALGIGVVAFNRAYWDRYYVGRPWYGRWGYYHGPGVTRTGSVNCAYGTCTGTRTTVGPRGRAVTRSGTVTRY